MSNREPRVLVVDDCEALRYLKMHYLRGAGFQVSQADTGNAALRSIEAERPDLVLLDVNLPDIHGSEVCREVKTRWALPVVYTSSADIPPELQGTADGWVVSLEEMDLLRAVQQALDPRSRLKPRPDRVAAPGNTRIAPSRRSPPAEIAAQARVFESGLLREALDASTALLLVLNENQEIVFCNRAALNLAGVTSLPAVLGLQPGEALRCVHATPAPEGCGTTEFCETCGALPSVLGGLGGGSNSRECRIVRSVNGLEETCHLMVSASPIEARSGFVVCTLVDFSHEKRRQVIERRFFHDILNLAGGVKGLVTLLRDELDGGTNTEFAAMAEQSAAELVAEIHSQRQLSLAEAGQLSIARAEIGTLELIQTAAAEYRGYPGSRECTILVDPGSSNLRMETDPAILSCVLGNMLKNALEATGPGGTVTIGCQAAQGEVELWVHNAGVIPREVQLEIFARSFSTKGDGRILRTYGMKLLTGRYLGGTVRFESGPFQGTRFIARIPAARADAAEADGPIRSGVMNSFSLIAAPASLPSSPPATLM
jgi:DNA-binding response OmpR family regulator